MATLKDISEMVNVSASAISRVLSGDESINVSEDTRRKIMAAARSLNYKPVKKKKPKKPARACRIGIAQMFDVTQLLEDVYYLVMKSAVEEWCFEFGNESAPLFRNSDGEFHSRSDLPLDGIVAIGSFSPDEVARLESLSPNLVFLDSSPDDLRYCSIIPNYETGVRLALNHLIANQHADIGFLGSEKRFGSDKTLEQDGRYAAFTRELSSRGMLNGKFIYHCEMNSRSSYAVMSKAIKSGKKLPTALFVSSDSMAGGLMSALAEAGLEAPRDIGVVTFNDTSVSANLGLSSIGVNIRANAKAAMLMMEELLTDNLLITQKIIISCYFKDRGSVLSR